MPASVFRAALYSLSSHFGSLALVLMPQPRRHLSLLLTQPQALWARSVGGGRGCARLPHQAHRPITCRQKELANRFYNGTLRAVTQDHKPLSSAGASTARSAGRLFHVAHVMRVRAHAAAYDTQQSNTLLDESRKYTTSYGI